MIGKILRDAMRAIALGRAELPATEFRLMSRKAEGAREGAVVIRLSWEEIAIAWEMTPDEALELSERLRVSAIGASLPAAAKEHKVSKQTGQA